MCVRHTKSITGGGDTLTASWSAAGNLYMQETLVASNSSNHGVWTPIRKLLELSLQLFQGGFSSFSQSSNIFHIEVAVLPVVTTLRRAVEVAQTSPACIRLASFTSLHHQHQSLPPLANSRAELLRACQNLMQYPQHELRQSTTNCLRQKSYTTTK